MKKNKQDVVKLDKKQKFIEWLLYMLGYSVVFILVSLLFDTVYIDLSNCGIYALLLSIIVSILNQTIKPFLLRITMPLTGLTLGLFYFVINLFILKLGDWVLLEHFNIGTNIYAFLIAITISAMNLLVESIVIKPMIRRLENNE